MHVIIDRKIAGMEKSKIERRTFPSSVAEKPLQKGEASCI